MFIITKEKPTIFPKIVRTLVETGEDKTIVFTGSKSNNLNEWKEMGDRVQPILNQWLFHLPQHAFEFGIIDGILDSTIIYKLKMLLKAEGYIFLPIYNNNIVPYFIEQIAIKKRDIGHILKEEAKIKASNDVLKKEYEKKVSEWRNKKITIQNKNKALKEAYEVEKKVFKELLKTTPKEAQKYMKEPKAPTLEKIPKKPEPPTLEEIPKRPTFLFDRGLERTIGWIVFSNFEVTTIIGEEEGHQKMIGYLLKKRPEGLRFSFQTISEIKINDISLEELIEIKKSSRDNPKKLEDVEHQYVQVSDIDAISNYLNNSVLSEEDYPLFSEEVENVDNSSTIKPLTPVKPMHAASMLAGGIGEYSREFTLDGEPYLIKAAIVKEYSTRKKRENGKEFEETIEHYEQKMGVYNLFRKELKILG